MSGHNTVFVFLFCCCILQKTILGSTVAGFNCASVLGRQGSGKLEK